MIMRNDDDGVMSVMNLTHPEEEVPLTFWFITDLKICLTQNSGDNQETSRPNVVFFSIVP